MGVKLDYILGKLRLKDVTDLTSVETRITNLENHEYKITYFESVGTATGTVTKPVGSTILLDQFAGGVDAYVSTIVNGQPTGIFPQTAGGVIVDVTSFNTAGDYVLSGTPSAFNVAIIYIIKIPALYLDNAVIANRLDIEDINIQQYITQTITNGVTDKAPSEDAVFDALALKVDTFTIPFVGQFNSPADSTTYYIGNWIGIVPQATDTNVDFNVGYALQVIGCVIQYGQNSTIGTTEDSTLQLRNTTAGTSSSIGTFKTDGGLNIGISTTHTGLSISVAAGDSICLQWDTPAWATNPVGGRLGGYLICKRT